MYMTPCIPFCSKLYVCMCICTILAWQSFPVVSKSEIAKVTKLYHRLETDESGVVLLSSVTKLAHFRNNALVKLVVKQYSKTLNSLGENDSKESVRNNSGEEVYDLEKFIELFDILSPKKDISSKLEGIYSKHIH